MRFSNKYLTWLKKNNPKAYEEIQKQKKEPKYANKKTVHAGMSFASKGEADCYDYLVNLNKAGEIGEIACQVHVYLTDAAIDLIVDFAAEEFNTSQLVYHEYKGYETDVWRIKRRLWKYYGPGRLYVYKKNSRGIYLHETITPKRS